MTSSIQSFYNTRTNSRVNNITTDLYENDNTYSRRQKITPKEVAQQLRKSERSIRKENRRSIVENKGPLIVGPLIVGPLIKRHRATVDYYESDQEDDASDGDYGETADTDSDSDSDYDPEEDQDEV
jgi:hypothetical protein